MVSTRDTLYNSGEYNLFDHCVLSSLLVLTHSILRRTLCEIGYYYCHFINEGAEEQKDYIASCKTAGKW